MSLALDAMPTATVAAQPVAISADGSALLAHTVEAAEEAPRSADRATASAKFEATGTPAEARDTFRAFFDIEATARFIVEQRCRRIGLQFPDELLPHATNVVRELREEVAACQQTNETTATTDASAAATETAAAVPAAASAAPALQLYILADTSYGSCCVDEVAAQHANCDLIVHFGFSCLSRSGQMGEGEWCVPRRCRHTRS